MVWSGNPGFHHLGGHRLLARPCGASSLMATTVEPGSGRPATDSGLASTSEAAEVPKRRASSRTRLIGARALTVVAILLALVGMLAYYVAHTALDDSGFETIARLS